MRKNTIKRTVALSFLTCGLLGLGIAGSNPANAATADPAAPPGAPAACDLSGVDDELLQDGALEVPDESETPDPLPPGVSAACLNQPAAAAPAEGEEADTEAPEAADPAAAPAGAPAGCDLSGVDDELLQDGALEVPDESETPDPLPPGVSAACLNQPPAAAPAVGAPAPAPAVPAAINDRAAPTNASVLSGGMTGATPSGGAAAGAGGMTPGGGRDTTPFVLAGVSGLALLAASAAAERRYANRDRTSAI